MREEVYINSLAEGARLDIRPEIAEGHRPYTLGTGDRACLLVHGIAGSPAQMRYLGEELASAGFKAHSILLPGHGTHPRDLHGIVWQDWYEHVHDKYHALKKESGEAALIGFSIGAALCTLFAARNHVDKLALLNVPLCPLNDRYPTGLMLKIYSIFFDKVKGRAQRFVDGQGHPFSYVYDWVPTKVLYTMLDLVGTAKRNLHRIEAPVLVIQSRDDKVSGGKSGPLVYNKVASEIKRLVMLDGNEHSIMAGEDKTAVSEKVISFLNGEMVEQ